MKQLDGKIAIVTGAGSGIGRAIATLLAAEGARVVASDINADTAKETAAAIAADGGEAIGTTADVASPVDLESLVHATLEAYGGVDILCNNAGITDRVELMEQDWDRWDLIQTINVKAVAMLSQKVAPEMLKRRGGSIVNTASVAGHVGGAAGLAYTASKHAVIGVTRQLATTLGPQGIRVNAFSPGPTITPITELWTKADPDFVARISADKPLRRWAEPSEQAAAALFLASDASAYVTGQILAVDGGWTARA